MTDRQKLFTIMIVTATITCLAIGSTFAYWTWSTSSAQATSVTFTVASGFNCSADGGGNITSSDVELVPAECTNSAYAIKRTVKILNHFVIPSLLSFIPDLRGNLINSKTLRLI